MIKAAVLLTAVRSSGSLDDRRLSERQTIAELVAEVLDQAFVHRLREIVETRRASVTRGDASCASMAAAN